MLDERAVYERELAACRRTFDNIAWPDGTPAELQFNCPACHSDLVAQQDPSNSSHEMMDCCCRSCGNRISAEVAFTRALEACFESESYFAVTDGGEQPVQDCPECGLSNYLLTEDHVGCLWCGLVLGECARCRTGLTPESVSPNTHGLCGYCEYLMSKDD